MYPKEIIFLTKLYLSMHSTFIGEQFDAVAYTIMSLIDSQVTLLEHFFLD